MTDLALRIPSAMPGVTPLAVVDGDEYIQVAWVLRRPVGGGQPELYCLPEEWPTSSAGRLAELHEIVAQQRQQLAEQQAELLAGAGALTAQRQAREALETQAAQLQRRIAELEAQAGQASHTQAAPAALAVELDPQARDLLAGLTERLAEAERQLRETKQHTQAAVARSQEALIQRYEADLADLRSRLAEAQKGRGTRLDIPAHSCPDCGRSFDTPRGLQTHIRTMHTPDPAWRCPQCQSDAFAQSLADPERCIRCAKEEPPQAAAAAA